MQSELISVFHSFLFYCQNKGQKAIHSITARTTLHSVQCG